MKAAISALTIALVSFPAFCQKSPAPLTIVGGEAATAKPAASAATAPSSSPVTATPAAAAPTLMRRSVHFGPGVALFIEPMNGFENFLEGAILKKKVPVVVVDDRSKADFIMTGVSDEAKAGWAKVIFVSPSSHAQASITIKDAHTGNLVFAYNVDKMNAARANQSTAEACAKHLKDALEKK